MKNLVNMIIRIISLVVLIKGIITGSHYAMNMIDLRVNMSPNKMTYVSFIVIFLVHIVIGALLWFFSEGITSVLAGAKPSNLPEIHVDSQALLDVGFKIFGAYLIIDSLVVLPARIMNIMTLDLNILPSEIRMSVLIPLVMNLMVILIGLIMIRSRKFIDKIR